MDPPPSEGSGQVSVGDFKTFESSMSTQISELHEMIAQLIQAKTPSAPPPEKTATPQVENVGVEEEDADKCSDAKSRTKGGGKGEFPHWYLIRLQRIYNFLCSMLVFYTICPMFRYTSWHFYAFSGTNLLTSCHSASSLFSAVFVFQK
jgi:hypothetical protein